jgi:hypothetical protein
MTTQESGLSRHSGWLETMKNKVYNVVDSFNKWVPGSKSFKKSLCKALSWYTKHVMSSSQRVITIMFIINFDIINVCYLRNRINTQF